MEPRKYSNSKKSATSLFLLLSITLFSVNSFSQSVGIGTTTPNVKSILELSSVNQGFLIPRMDDAGMAAIGANSAADDGMMIYNTTQGQFMYYDAVVDSWEPVGGGGSDNDWVENADTIYNDLDYVVVGQQQAIDYIRMLVVNNGTRTALAGSSDGDGVEAVGVEGFATGANDFNIGVIGIGEATSPADTAVGIYGSAENVQGLGAGVRGEAVSTAAGTHLVGGSFEARDDVGGGDITGVEAIGDGTGVADTVIGLRGAAFGGSVNWSGYFESGDLFVNDNVGIGISNPLAPLHVNGEAIIGNAGLICAAGTAGAMRYNGGSGEIEYCDGTAWQSMAGADSDWIINGNDIYNGNVGNVGIHTSSPITPLQIGPMWHFDTVGPYALMGNNITFNGSDFVRTVAGTGQVMYMGDEEFQVELFGLGAAGSNTNFEDTARFKLDWHGARIEVRNEQSGDFTLSVGGATRRGLQIYADSLGNSIPASLSFFTNGNEIGITPPDNLFNTYMLTLPDDLPTVDGDVLTSNTLGELYWSSPSGQWLINGDHIYNGNSENVGVGVTNPNAKLNVYANTNSPLLDSLYDNRNSLAGQRLSFSTGDVFEFGFQQTPTYAGWMQAGYNGTGEPILINPLGGNVGVNNNNPSAQLDVIGTFKLSDGTEALDRVLTSDGAGNATWQDLPTGVDTNIYNMNGTLSGNRIVTQGSNNLTFNSTSTSGSPFSVLNQNAGGTSFTGGSHAARMVLTSDGTEQKTGLEVDVSGTGTGLQQAITGTADGAATGGFNRGVMGSASNNSFTNYAGDFYATGDIGTNYGVRVNVGGTQASSKYGVFVNMSGSGNKYGLYVNGEDFNFLSGDLQFNGRLLPNGAQGTAGQVLTSQGAGTPTWTTPTNGDITGVTAGTGLTGGGTTGSVTLNAVGTNGLTTNANDIRLGGALIENTTITQGVYGMTFNMNSTGDFQIQDAGVNKFLINDAGNSFFGGDVYWRDASTGGTNLMLLSDDGDDGRLRIYENGVASVDLDANTQFIFNEQGLDRNFRVEGLNDANLLFVDAGTDNVGIGITNPTSKLEVVGDIEIPAANEYTYSTAKTDYFTVAAAGFTIAPNTANLTLRGFDSGNARWIVGGTPVAEYMYAPVSLPHGAVVTRVDFYVHDADATYDVSGSMYRQTFGSTLVTAMAATGTTTGSPGVTNVFDTTIGNATIDNANYSYYLRFNTVGANSSVRIYGAKVTYTVNHAD